MIRIDQHSTILVRKVGFSKGCEEFTPKYPPPFVPNCLIGTIAAVGPCETGLSRSFQSGQFHLTVESHRRSVEVSE